MVKNSPLPCIDRMTLFAVTRKARLYMIGIRGVVEISRMTAIAVRWNTNEHTTGVTLSTIHRCVTAG